MTCPACFIEFEPKRSDAKTCGSSACRKKYQREKLLKSTGSPSTGIAQGSPGALKDVIAIALAQEKEQSLSNEELIGGRTKAERIQAFIDMGIDKVEFLKTQIPELDEMTGGIPRGRVTEIYGQEGVGKTTLVLNLLRNLKDEKVLYIDTEGTTDPAHLGEVGLDPDNLTHVQHNMIEDVYEEVVNNLEGYAAIIIDSIAGCPARTELEGDVLQGYQTAKPIILGKLMRVVATRLGKTALVLVNQERHSIGGYVSQVYTPGGAGIKYACSLRLRLTTTKGARFPTAPPYKGQEVSIEITKSKVCAPFQKTKFKLYY